MNKTKPARHRIVAVKRVRKRSNPSPGRGTSQNKCRASAQEPWVLATSLNECSSTHIVELYALRMQIEETFRDAKNSRWGLCLNHARCRSAHRWSVLMLLCTLASLAVTLAGLATENANLHRHYQANTVTHRRVLSLFALGMQVLRRRDGPPTPELSALLEELPLTAAV